MTSVILDFADLMLAALVTGAMFGATLILNPAGLDAGSYVSIQQRGISTLNHVMPALGGITILITVAAAVVDRSNQTRLALLAGAALCFVATGLITRLLNQPINAIVMTWGGVPAANWTELRDTWWRWHLVRLASGLAGLSLVIAATLRRA